MIKKLIEASIKHRILVLILSLFLALGGLEAWRTLPLDAIPDLSDVQVIVRTSYPGQAPQIVEDQITYPLTSAFLAVPGAVTVRGFSFFGDSYVYVLFKEGTDAYWARSRVLEYLNQVSGQLPEGVRPRLGPDATGVGWIFQYALVDHSGQHDLADLTSLQNWFLKFELQSLEAISEVASVGGMVRQYQVELDPTKLRIFNLSFAKVREAIQQANGEAGGSVIELAEAEYLVRAKGYIKSLEDLASIPVAMPVGGTPLLLKDVAHISKGPQLRRAVADLNGEGEAVGGVVIVRAGENALQAIKRVKEKLDSLKASLPDGVEIIPVYDRSNLIERAIDTLRFSLFEELVIVALTCLVFLMHVRSALAIVLALPLGIFAAIIIMRLQGVSANIMSLGGIAIAIGTMVDAAIVMVESLHRRLERDIMTKENRWRIVSEVAGDVGPALFFSLLIIMVSFLPILALEAQEGRLFKPLAYTKTYAMAAAAFLSVTLVPVLMGYFIRGTLKKETENPVNRLLHAGYNRLLSWSFKGPRLASLFVIMLGLSGLYPLSQLGSEFMPNLDEGDIMYMPVTLPGVSIGKARELVQQTNKLIMSLPEVATSYAKSGRALSATDPAPLTMTETVIQLKPQSEWRSGMSAEKIRAELDRLVQIPGLSNAWVMPIKARIDMLATGIRTPLGLRISGPDLGLISQIGEAAEQLLKQVPGTASAYAERVVGGRYLEIEIDRETAARYGLNIAMVQDLVRSAIGGAVISETVEGRERYPINLRFPRDVRDSVEDIANLPMVTPSGAHVPLKSFVTLKLVPGPGMIRSENAQLTGTVFIDITDSDILGYVRRAKRELEKTLVLPAGYSLTWAGQFEYIERAKARLQLIIPATIFAIMMLLYAVFKRFLDVFLVMLTVPLALSGGFWYLYALGYNLSVAVVVGLIALAGLAAETGVVMLVFLRQATDQDRNSQTAQGQTDAPPTKEPAPLKDPHLKGKIIGAALIRLRPIMMTVLTVVLGLIPVMISSGTGSELMKRVAAPMVGGMITATLFSLIATPLLFFLLVRKR